jgi:3-phosphoglycerate kinase
MAIRFFEMENFANGTIELGKYIAASTAKGAFSLWVVVTSSDSKTIWS